MEVFISSGNTKVGEIPNVSISPIVSCIPNAPCIKECYALNAYNRWPNVKNAWDKNYKIYKDDWIKYFIDVSRYLREHNPTFFRWHVGGDIPDQRYFDGMWLLAHQHKDIKFLAFTKRYDLNYSSDMPDNLSIVLSAWPNFPLPKSDLPIAFMQDGTEDRVVNAIECIGSCDNCGMCWSLKELGKNVVFNKH